MCFKTLIFIVSFKTNNYGETDVKIHHKCSICESKICVLTVPLGIFNFKQGQFTGKIFHFSFFVAVYIYKSYHQLKMKSDKRKFDCSPLFFFSIVTKPFG